MTIRQLRRHLLAGQAIPAMPLALDRRRRWSQRRQRAVLRYYMDAGAGGIAVGVHSTQFEIRDPEFGLFEPILSLARSEIDTWRRGSTEPFVRIAGVCGLTRQACKEAELARSLGYHAGLLSLAGPWKEADDGGLVRHCAEVANILPLIGFYLQPSVGGRILNYRFWRDFAEIPNVVAVKIAPFNRYQTLETVRAIIESGRTDIALYTGNDDNIIVDLLTNFGTAASPRHIVGGLLGQWGVWTERAVALFNEIKQARAARAPANLWLEKNADLTDANAAIFDARNQFAGCIPGINEMLRRQGIFDSTACLDPELQLSPGQAQELDRITRAYPWMQDKGFVEQNLPRWLS